MSPSNSTAYNGDRSIEDAEYNQDELVAQLELLSAENHRLRKSVSDARRHHYRGIAAGLFIIGVICGVLAFGTTAGSDVLFALAGIGVFGGMFTYFLTPDRFIPADLGERVYAATATSYERICADLGLSARRVYVPLDRPNNGSVSTKMVGDKPTRLALDDVRLFIPQRADVEVPDEDTLRENAFVVDARNQTHGLSVLPTGSGLYDAFMNSLDGSLEDEPRELYRQLSDCVVEDFELARSTTVDLDRERGRMSVEFADALYDDRARFDHPIASFFAVGLANGLNLPIETTITSTAPLSVTFRWDDEPTSQTHN